MKEILTPRQLEITKLIAWGLTHKEVASKLGISTNTVLNTVRNIFFRTGVTKVNELSAWYFCKTYGISKAESPFKCLIVSIIIARLIISLHAELVRHSDLIVSMLGNFIINK